MPAPSPRERPAFKQANLERCICRIREVRVSDLPIRQDHLKRDAIILNLHRALECLLSMGSYLVRKMKLDWSGDSAAVFDLLAQAGMLSAEQGARLQTLMSRRQPIFDGGLDVVEQVVENHLDEIIDTGRTLLRQAPDLAVEPGTGLHPLIVEHRAALLALAPRHGLTNLRVYGSMARGDADEHSDVDLLVCAPPGVTCLTLGGMSIDAEELLQRRVDVLTDGELLSPLRARILQEAVAL